MLAFHITEDQMAARKRQSKSIKSKPVPRSSGRGVTASKTTSLGSVAKPASAKSSIAKVSKKEKVLGMLRESDARRLPHHDGDCWQEHRYEVFSPPSLKEA